MVLIRQMPLSYFLLGESMFHNSMVTYKYKAYVAPMEIPTIAPTTAYLLSIFERVFLFLTLAINLEQKQRTEQQIFYNFLWQFPWVDKCVFSVKVSLHMESLAKGSLSHGMFVWSWFSLFFIYKNGCIRFVKCLEMMAMV